MKLQDAGHEVVSLTLASECFVALSKCDGASHNCEDSPYGKIRVSVAQVVASRRTAMPPLFYVLEYSTFHTDSRVKTSAVQVGVYVWCIARGGAQLVLEDDHNSLLATECCKCTTLTTLIHTQSC